MFRTTLPYAPGILSGDDVPDPTCYAVDLQHHDWG